ncbi:MAG: o-succinylbenzoate--CoA ligase [Chlorobiaceae bacterium]
MDIVGRAAQLFGNSPAIIVPEKALSFNDCADSALYIANLLSHKGCHTGDIIAIVSPNTPELFLTLLGLLKAGMVAAPLNYRLPKERLNVMLAKLQPKLVLTHSELDLPFYGLKTVTLTAFLENTLPYSITDIFALKEMERPATIIHTSASSGEAKAAVHSVANHWYSAIGSNENLPFSPGDCWLLSLPLYHIGGYSLLFRAFVSGAAVAIDSPDESITSSLQNFPLTHLSLVPTQLYRLLADTKSTALLRNLKAVLLGGSSSPNSLIKDALCQNIRLYLSYGSTEMSSQIATTPEPISSIQQNSGRVLPHREIRAAKDGELLVKGATLFKGYLNCGEIQPQTDNNGWFHTSDIGSVSDDGTVTVIGRKDSMFISAGENIHPEEIEKALMMIDGIRDALIVPVPDHEYGQRPVAFIRTFDKNNPSDSTISLTLNTMIGKLKTPTSYFRITHWLTLPGSQKIDRTWYKKLALAQKK